MAFKNEPDEVVNSSQSVEKSKIVEKENNRQIENQVKFIKSENVRIKPQADSVKEMTSVVTQSTVSEDLQIEKANILKDGYGTIPPISMAENKHMTQTSRLQKQSVIEALQTEKNPERLSLVGKRESFDTKKYLQDPSLYLSVSVPSRAFEAAQPGEGVPILKRVSPQYLEVYQDESVELILEGVVPNMPVSATTHDGGTFETDLSSITVKADGSGRVIFSYSPGQGVIADTRISVASPLSSGVVRFNVNVKKIKEEGLQK